MIFISFQRFSDPKMVISKWLESGLGHFFHQRGLGMSQGHPKIVFWRFWVLNLPPFGRHGSIFISFVDAICHICVLRVTPKLDFVTESAISNASQHEI